MHHAGAGLNIELRKLLALHLLQRARGMDRLVPASLFAADLFVRILHPVDPERDRNVQLRTFFHDARDIREDTLVDLAVRHQVNRIELVVLVKRANDLRQVFSRKRLAAGKHKHAEIAAERFRDLGDLIRLHLQLFTRPVVELLGKKAVRAAHIADAGYKNV